MKIHTTINISQHNKNILDTYSKKLNISKSELIINLLALYFDNTFNRFKTFQQVRYQNKISGTVWKPVHVFLPCSFYEKCIDSRNFYKLSLSYILAQAIDLYLDKVTQKAGDNYQHNYLFLPLFSINQQIILIAWNIPPTKIMEKIMKMYENT